MCTTSARPATRRHAVRTAPPESVLRVEDPARSTLRVEDPARSTLRVEDPARSTLRVEDLARSTLRVGGAERENTAARLGGAFTLGYLSMDEYEARLGHAFGAQTAAELDRLTTDLPVDEISRRDPRRRDARLRAARRGAQVHLISYVALSLLMIGIWLAVGVGTGSWYFWPIWPIVGMGIGVIGHAMSVAQARGVGVARHRGQPGPQIPVDDRSVP